MRSYAQNFEDVRLDRVFGRQAAGFYIDVGAADPLAHSVTKAFYERGWRGINIEPDDRLLRRLVEDRPRDINLGVACSDADGELDLYATDVPDGWATTSVEAAAHLRSVKNRATHPTRVKARRLTSILDEHRVSRIDFLKIDVEGYEQQVLAGSELSRWRPVVLLIEATWPHTPQPTYTIWERHVIDAGYVFSADDGLNRFYVRNEDAQQIGPILARPISPFDDWELDHYLGAIEARDRQIAALEVELHELRQRGALRLLATRASRLIRRTR